MENNDLSKTTSENPAPPPNAPETSQTQSAPEGGILKRLRTYRDDVAAAMRGSSPSVISMTLAEHERGAARAKAEELRLKAQEEYRKAREELERARALETPSSIKRIRDLVAPPNPEKAAASSELKAAEDRLKRARERLEAQSATLAPVLRPPRSYNWKRIAVISVLFIGGVGMAAGGVWFYRSQSTPSGNLAQVSPVVFSDATETVGITGLEGEGLRAHLLERRSVVPENPGSIAYLLLVSGEPETKVESVDFLSSLDTNAEAQFIRSLEGPYMFGYYREAEGSVTPFIIFTTTYFSAAFAGMLQWEASMQSDLAPWFGSGGGEFEDRVIRNKDARVLAGEGGVTLLYAFLDRSTILITGSEAALGEIVTRISAGRVVR